MQWNSRHCPSYLCCRLVGGTRAGILNFELSVHTPHVRCEIFYQLILLGLMVMPDGKPNLLVKASGRHILESVRMRTIALVPQPYWLSHVARRIIVFGCACVLCIVCGALKIILPFLSIHQFRFGIMVDLCTEYAQQ